MILTFYLLALAALAVHVPDVLSRPDAGTFFVILGLVAGWRYGWEVVHLVRALIYRHAVFPAWRRAAGALGEAGRAPHVFIVVTSRGMPGETTARAYQAAIGEAVRYGAPATILADAPERADQRLVKRVFLVLAPPPHVRLAFVHRSGAGRRHAIACALRAIARRAPPGDAAVVVIDGDVLLAPCTLERSLAFLHCMPDVDAITTDLRSVVDGAALLRSWHALRLARRHQLMSSLGLSRRLLAPSGGMAIYRATVATDPAFIDIVENDRREHWRLGRFELAAEEDESIWLWLLQRRRAMLYLPDVEVLTIVHPPKRRLASVSTMFGPRWYDGMLRSNGRAIALGPRHAGAFTWWCLVERRISMWASLTGPTLAILFALAKSAAFFHVYLMWIGATRLVEALALLTARPRISGTWPPLIYIDQVYGALLGTCVLFHPDRGRRRVAREPAAPARRVILRRLGSAYVHGLALGTLVAAVAFGTGILSLPPLRALAAHF